MGEQGNHSMVFPSVHFPPGAFLLEMDATLGIEIEV